MKTDWLVLARLSVELLTRRSLFTAWRLSTVLLLTSWLTHLDSFNSLPSFRLSNTLQCVYKQQSIQCQQSLNYNSSSLTLIPDDRRNQGLERGAAGAKRRVVRSGVQHGMMGVWALWPPSRKIDTCSPMSDDHWPRIYILRQWWRHAEIAISK